MTEMTVLSWIMLEYWNAKCDHFYKNQTKWTKWISTEYFKIIILSSFLKILTYQKENKLSDNEIMKIIYRIIFWTK